MFAHGFYTQDSVSSLQYMFDGSEIHDVEARFSDYGIEDESVIYSNKPIEKLEEGVIGIQIIDLDRRKLIVRVPSLDILMREFKMYAKDVIQVAPSY